MGWCSVRGPRTYDVCRVSGEGREWPNGYDMTDPNLRDSNRELQIQTSFMQDPQRGATCGRARSQTMSVTHTSERAMWVREGKGREGGRLWEEQEGKSRILCPQICRNLTLISRYLFIKVQHMEKVSRIPTTSTSCSQLIYIVLPPLHH